MLVFNIVFFEPAVADRNAMRHTDQLPIGEHHTGAFASIVEHHVYSGGDDKPPPGP